MTYLYNLHPGFFRLNAVSESIGLDDIVSLLLSLRHFSSFFFSNIAVVLPRS